MHLIYRPVIFIFLLVISLNVFSKEQDLFRINCNLTGKYGPIYDNDTFDYNGIIYFDGSVDTYISKERLRFSRFLQSINKHKAEFCSSELAFVSRDYGKELSRITYAESIFLGSVFFPNGSSVAIESNIDSFRKKIPYKSDVDYVLLFVGSTDAVGEYNYNALLSYGRAKYLKEQINVDGVKNVIIPLVSRGKKGQAHAAPLLRRADVYILKI